MTPIVGLPARRTAESGDDRPVKSLDARATAAALPWDRLCDTLARTIDDAAAGRVRTPERWVLPIAPGTSWFLMPAWLAPEAGDLAAVKLITYAAANPARGLVAILGQVLAIRASTGEPLALLDGPTVTERRTAAVSALAARHLAPAPGGPLLIVGTGVQARAHAQAFAALLGVRDLRVRGRNPQRSAEFAASLRELGLAAQPADDLSAALRDCPLVVTATPAREPCLAGTLRADVFVAAVGAFTPSMVEIDPALTREIAARGRIVLDSAAARHEAGDLIVAAIATDALPGLVDLPARPAAGPVLFKSCGSALWDLAAARCAVG
jgi:1-piperideine-2-carboxylate/1-pyrroline-2-carboxylate reductase [NAD(P)H]